MNDKIIKNLPDENFQYNRTLSLEEIQKIIALYNGTYSFFSTQGKGNSITIKFLHSNDLHHYSQPMEKQARDYNNIHQLFPDERS
ncbi:MAG: hypothetical protein JKY53_14920 [Flavobacteriales bacterium]|nr:hypothetical protein [Flavobacteriales bacterium]